MRESDFIAPLGIMTLLASLKGLQNRQDAQTAYANEVERLNQLALQSQEDEEIPPIGDPNRGSNPNIDQSQAGSYFDDAGNEKVMGDEFQSVSNFDAIMSILDPVTTIANIATSPLSSMTDEEIEDFYMDPDVDYTGDGIIDAQDQAYGAYGFDRHRQEFDLQKGDRNIHGNIIKMDSPMYDAGNPYRNLGYKDGGRIHLKGGGMDASKADFGKSKNKDKDDTKNNDNTKNKDDTKNKPATVGSLTPTMTPFKTPTPEDVGPLGTMSMALGFMDDEDSSPLGSFGFNIGDVSVNVNPFGATQIGMTAPLGSIPGIGGLFGYKQ